jgi:hypothetical protein
VPYPSYIGVIPAVAYRREETVPAGPLYYIQDVSKFLGRDIAWRLADGTGYTTKLAEAGVFSREAAYAQYERCPTDMAQGLCGCAAGAQSDRR